MVRPCILVVDREFPGTISTRKLLLETSKFNVVTAYSGREAIELIRNFPKLDAAVLDEVYFDMDCESLAAMLKQIAPTMPIVATTASGESSCQHVDRVIRSYDPGLLLAVVREFFPQTAHEILENEKRLAEG